MRLLTSALFLCLPFHSSRKGKGGELRENSSHLTKGYALHKFKKNKKSRLKP